MFGCSKNPNRWPDYRSNCNETGTEYSWRGPWYCSRSRFIPFPNRWSRYLQESVEKDIKGYKNKTKFRKLCFQNHYFQISGREKLNPICPCIFHHMVYIITLLFYVMAEFPTTFSPLFILGLLLRGLQNALTKDRLTKGKQTSLLTWTSCSWEHL